MDEFGSWGLSALEGVERLRKRDGGAFRDRMCTLLLLLRGAYFSGDGKWRAMAEEDLRALYRGGVHDHIGGGFFSDSGDVEWLRPRGEKRLVDNALLAFILAEAWESGHMAFYRESAEGALDFCLRELKGEDGLFAAALFSEDGTAAPWLFTPEEVASALGEEKAQGFSECYDITPEGNFGEGSIPNLILNQRWSLLPEGYDDLRERLREYRGRRGGTRLASPASPEENALMLAALSKCARVFSDARYLYEARALCEAMGEIAEPTAGSAACALFALCELYRAELDPRRLTAARRLALRLRELTEDGSRIQSLSDPCLAAAALGLDELWRLSGEEDCRRMRGALLRELCLHSERHSLAAAPGFCVLLGALSSETSLVCVSRGETLPERGGAMLGRYAPDCVLLLKTPARADELGEAAPYTRPLEFGERDALWLFRDGKREGSLSL